MVAATMTNTLLTLLSAELIKQHCASGHWRDDTIYSLVRDHARRGTPPCATVSGKSIMRL